MELQKIGKSYIKFKGEAEINIHITSRNDFLILGEKYQFNSPINQLNGDYFVKGKKTKIFQNPEVIQIVYEYELTNSFDTENELNYFDNQRAKSNGNIAQGEYIFRNIDLESELNIIFNNLSIEEIQVDGENTLNCALNVPLIK